MEVNAHRPAVLIAEDEALIREALRQELDKRYKVAAAVETGNGYRDRREGSARCCNAGNTSMRLTGYLRRSL